MATCKYLGFGWGYFGHTPFGHGMRYIDVPFFKLEKITIDRLFVDIIFVPKVDSYPQDGEYSALNTNYYELEQSEKPYSKIKPIKVYYKGIDRRFKLEFELPLELGRKYKLKCVAHEGKTIRWLKRPDCYIQDGYGIEFLVEG